MPVSLELLRLQGRACPRVYHALAWVCIRARRDPEKRLRKFVRLLDLTPEEARELEAVARTDRAVRIGRDPTERVWLHQALSELGRAHPALAAIGAILVARVAPPCPFEDSLPGEPIVLPPRWSVA